MSVLCLTGWQQPADALHEIAPDALHFDYAAYDDIEAVFAGLPKAPPLAIGWSLGGQILARAIAAGHTKPAALILLGASFQGMASPDFPDALPTVMFAEFRENYRNDGAATLKQMQALIALGDTDAPRIMRMLTRGARLWHNGVYWLDVLGAGRCGGLDYAHFPPTFVIQGLSDKVCYPAHGRAFARHIAGAELQLWEGCAHAPHLHAPQTLQAMVRRYV